MQLYKAFEYLNIRVRNHGYNFITINRRYLSLTKNLLGLVNKNIINKFKLYYTLIYNPEFEDIIIRKCLIKLINRSFNGSAKESIVEFDYELDIIYIRNVYAKEWFEEILKGIVNINYIDSKLLWGFKIEKSNLEKIFKAFQIVNNKNHYLLIATVLIALYCQILSLVFNGYIIIAIILGSILSFLLRYIIIALR